MTDEACDLWPTSFSEKPAMREGGHHGHGISEERGAKVTDGQGQDVVVSDGDALPPGSEGADDESVQHHGTDNWNGRWPFVVMVEVAAVNFFLLNMTLDSDR